MFSHVTFPVHGFICSDNFWNKNILLPIRQPRKQLQLACTDGSGRTRPRRTSFLTSHPPYALRHKKGRATDTLLCTCVNNPALARCSQSLATIISTQIATSIFTDSAWMKAHRNLSRVLTDGSRTWNKLHLQGRYHEIQKLNEIISFGWKGNQEVEVPTLKKVTIHVPIPGHFYLD